MLIIRQDEIQGYFYAPNDGQRAECNSWTTPVGYYHYQSSAKIVASPSLHSFFLLRYLHVHT